MVDYSWVTDEMFDKKLEEIVGRASAGDLLAIPGVYEVVSEHFNNDVLTELENERSAEGEEDGSA